MLEKLKNLFRSDEFIPSASVFPSIDMKRIAKDLKLEEEGTARGQATQPDTKAKTLDHIELAAIAQVEELRRRGLENYEVNQSVYAERLNLAGSARMQVETDASDAKSRFSEEVKIWKNIMVTPRERVVETFKWRHSFRQRNKIERPAKSPSSWPNIIGLALLMIVLESIGNGYLFAQKNSLGLLGGIMAALLVSFGNVAVCSLLGFASRYVNSANLFLKLIGLIFFLAFVGFTLGYNLAVAHFRDAVERIGDWGEAGIASIQTLVSSPLGLGTMESYILFLLGAFISVIAFLKIYTSFDPYPGYANVAKDVLSARETYVNHLQDSINDLADHRDDAVETLRLANDEVQRNINDSIEALFGQKALNANLSTFLEQCDIAAIYVLATYRDANKAARSSDAPDYFNEPFSFANFVPQSVDTSRRETAEAHVSEISNMVTVAIRDIFDVFTGALNAHYEIDELEGTHLEKPKTPNSLSAISAPTPLKTAAPTPTEEAQNGSKE